jgi:hypothetical protein
VTYIGPAGPLVADPEPIITDPLVPLTDTPVLNTRAPLIPEAPVFAVEIIISPLVLLP